MLMKYEVETNQVQKQRRQFFPITIPLLGLVWQPNPARFDAIFSTVISASLTFLHCVYLKLAPYYIHNHIYQNRH
jgi:hypothetical protein